MYRTITGLLTGFCCLTAMYAANLTISGQTNRTYDGGTYQNLVIGNSSNITIRNCTFASGSGHVVDIQAGCSGILVENCDINGLVDACTGVNMGGGCHGITFKHCDIHEIADDGFQIVNADDIHLLYNRVYRLYGCGTDNGCGPCYNGHSDGLEFNDNDVVEIVGNLIYDVRSTAALMIDTWDNSYTNNVVVSNNIFYTPECGIVAYFDDCVNVQVYHNTIWGGGDYGVAIGGNTRNLDMQNNILQNIDFNHMQGTYDPAQHHIDYNAYGKANIGFTRGTHDFYAPNPLFTKIGPVVGATPYRDVTAADFELRAGSPCIDKGTSGGDIPTTDLYGHERTGVPDLGALEFQGTGLGYDPRRAAAARVASPVIRAFSGRFNFPAAGQQGFRLLDSKGRIQAMGGKLDSGIYFGTWERSTAPVRKLVVIR